MHGECARDVSRQLIGNLLLQRIDEVDDEDAVMLVSEHDTGEPNGFGIYSQDVCCDQRLLRPHESDGLHSLDTLLIITVWSIVGRLIGDAGHVLLGLAGLIFRACIGLESRCSIGVAGGGLGPKEQDGLQFGRGHGGYGGISPRKKGAQSRR